MKKLFLTGLFMSLLFSVFGQSKLYLRGDSVYIQRDGGNGELIILNGSRNVTGGVLTNLGNGRTAFVPPSGGGGGGLSGGNLGAGYRVYVPGSEGVKTLYNNTGRGFSWDSTLNINGLTPLIDTTLLSTRAWIQKEIDLVPKGIFANSQVNNYLDSLRLLQAYILNLPSAWERFGDSYTDGGDNASADSAYFEHLAPFWGLTSVNRAAAGLGTMRMVTNHMTNINPGHTKMTTLQAILNDLRRGGTDRRTTNKYINTYKACFVNQFLASYTEAGAVSASITKSGGFSTGYNPNAVGGKSGTGAYTTTALDTVGYLFSGKSNVAWQVIGGDSVTYAYAHGTWKIYEVNGALVATGDFGTNQQYDGISDGSSDNGRGPIAFYYLGLDPTKTYRLTLTSKQSTNIFAVDYFGHMVDLGSAYAQIWIQPVYLTTTGYNAGGASLDNASDAIIDANTAANDSLFAVVSTTGYPVFKVATNTGWDKNTMLDVDGIHPNNPGHRFYYEKIAEVMPVLVNVPSEGTIVRTGSGTNTHAYLSNGTSLLQLDGAGGTGSGALPGQGLADSSGYLINLVWKGESGGGRVTGGTGSGDDLVIRSTAHATKGNIYAGPLNIDEANNLVGVNVAPSGTIFDLVNTVNTTYHSVRLKAIASQSGDNLRILNSSNTPLFRVTAGGGFGATGPLTSYDGAGLYGQHNSGTSYLDSYNGSSGFPLQTRSSTLGVRVGSGVSVNALDIATTGAVVFNEGGVAINFRIEGDADQNLLVTNGTTDFVGVGTASPVAKLHVNGDFKIETLAVTTALDSVLVKDNTVKYIDLTGLVKMNYASVGSTGTPTPAIPAATQINYYLLSGLATNATFGAPTGSPSFGYKLYVRINDDGTPRTLAWNAIYRGSTAFALPLITTGDAGDYIYLEFQWNELDSTWDAVGYTPFVLGWQIYGLLFVLVFAAGATYVENRLKRAA